MGLDGYSEQELAMLSDEERAALEDSTDEERKSLNAVAGVDDDDEGKDADGDGDGEKGDDGDDGAAGDGDDAGDGDGDGAGDDAGSGDDGDGSDDKPDRNVFAAKYHAEPVEGYADKMAELDQKFEDGDLELKDYNQQRDALVRAQLKAEISSEQQEQVEAQLWRREIDMFMDDHPEYVQRKLLNVAFDTAVKEVAADPANSDKTYRWFLSEAHKRVQEELGITQKQEQKHNADEGGKKNAKDVKPRGSDIKDAPPTLGKLPQAGAGESDAGEFDHIDRLEGIDYERALAKMSPEARERYLAA